jgi:hypothetical protein
MRPCLGARSWVRRAKRAESDVIGDCEGAAFHFFAVKDVLGISTRHIPSLLLLFPAWGYFLVYPSSIAFERVIVFYMS